MKWGAFHCHVSLTHGMIDYIISPTMFKTKFKSLNTKKNCCGRITMVFLKTIDHSRETSQCLWAFVFHGPFFFHEIPNLDPPGSWWTLMADGPAPPTNST